MKKTGELKDGTTYWTKCICTCHHDPCIGRHMTVGTYPLAVHFLPPYSLGPATTVISGIRSQHKTCLAIEQADSWREIAFMVDARAIIPTPDAEHDMVNEILEARAMRVYEKA